MQLGGTPLVPGVTFGAVSLVTLLLSQLELVSGLRCWQCIGDDCDKDPYLVDHAKPRDCRKGESCLKVFYRVKAAKTNVLIESTTRTCSAGQCLVRNDFVNCTNDKVENPGCMRQYCCDDRDMCNGALTTIHRIQPFWCFVTSAILVCWLSSWWRRLELTIGAG